MLVEPTPITLPSFPFLSPSLSASGQNKRSRVNLDVKGESDVEDTSASGTGTRHVTCVAGFADVSPPMQTTSTRHESPTKTAELTRAYAITAFMASPLLPDPDKLRVGHISALFAMAIEGHTQKAAIRLLAPEYSQAVAEKVWAAWEPHISPQPGHP